MTQDRSLAEELEFALALADRASVAALAEQAKGVHVHTKPDGSPVTNVDHAVDDLLTAALRADRTDDAILSEESGTHGWGSRRWILDPVDGTFNLVRGHPHWGVHVALEVNREIVVGVVTRPLLGLRWWATLGGGAFRGALSTGDAPTRLQVSSTADPGQSRVSTWTDAGDVIAHAQRIAIWQKFDMNDILAVAEGDLDAVIASPGEIWDHAPNLLLVEEAGGRFHDGHGGRRIDLGRGHYTNGAVDGGLASLIG